MPRRAGLFAFAVGLSLQVGCGLAATAPPPGPLEGRWVGKNMPGGDTVEITVEGDRLYFFARPDHQFDTVIELDEGTYPPRFKATIQDSPRTSEAAGEVVWAIYEHRGDQLKLMSGSGPEAPTAFEEGPSLYHLRRVPPGA